MRRPALLICFVVLFLAPTFCLFAQFEGGMLAKIEHPDPQLKACAFSPDGSFFVVGGDSLRIYDWESKRLVQQLRPERMPRFTGKITIPMKELSRVVHINGWFRRTQAIAFSPVNRMRFVSADADGMIRIWRFFEESPELVIPCRVEHVRELRFSPDGRFLVGLNDRYNRRGKVLGELRVWDTVDGSLRHEELFYNDHAAAICFTPDGTELAISRKSNDESRNSRIEFYDWETWEVVRTVELAQGGGSSILLLPDSERMIVTGGDRIPARKGFTPVGRIWLTKLDTRDPVQPLLGVRGGHFNFAELTSNGDEFLVRTYRSYLSGKVNQVQLRDCNDGRLLGTSDCDLDALQGMAIHPHGQQVAMLGMKAIYTVDPTGQNAVSIFNPAPSR